MEKLVRGVHAFKADVSRSQQELFERLAKGQRPDTLFITCSDSRVVPNLMTGTGPGELFLLRNAGNIIPPHGSAVSGESATIEYAVDVLGVKDIIVCGHTHCGAMQSLVGPKSSTPLPAFEEWLRHAEATKRIVNANYSHLSGEQLANVAVQENVLVQLDHLRTLPSVALKLSTGMINLHAWVYKIETSEVFSFDPLSDDFIPLGQSAVQPVPATRVSVLQPI